MPRQKVVLLVRPKTKIPIWWPRIGFDPKADPDWVTLNIAGGYSVGTDFSLSVSLSKIEMMKTEFRQASDRRQWEYRTIAVEKKNHYTKTHGKKKEKTPQKP